MRVTRGQLAYELAHLRAKLALRDPDALRRLAVVQEAEPHPMFEVVPGETEVWEVGARHGVVLTRPSRERDLK